MVLTRKEALGRLNGAGISVNIVSLDIYNTSPICVNTGGLLLKADIDESRNILTGAIFNIRTGLRLQFSDDSTSDMSSINLIIDKSTLRTRAKVQAVAAHIDSSGEIIATVTYRGEFADVVSRGMDLGVCLITDTVKYVPPLNAV